MSVVSDQLNRKQALAVSHYAGFRGKRLVQATAVMGAESARKYLAMGTNPDGSHDRGLYQINDRAHPDLSDSDAYLPLRNCMYAFKLSNEGRNFSPWAAYNSGRYLVNLVAMAATLAAEKAGLWKKDIAAREAVFDRAGLDWVPKSADG